jgi:hypothetical protein
VIFLLFSARCADVAAAVTSFGQRTRAVRQIHTEQLADGSVRVTERVAVPPGQTATITLPSNVTAVTAPSLLGAVAQATVTSKQPDLSESIEEPHALLRLQCVVRASDSGVL